MKVEGTDFAAIFVDDYDAAVGFYRDVLGLDHLDSRVCHMAPFADPAGNALLLHNRYAPR